MSHFLCMSCWRVLPEGEVRVECPECKGGRVESRVVEDWLVDPNEPAGAPEQRGRRGSWAETLLGAEGGRSARCERHPDAEPRRFCVCGELILPRSSLANGNALGLGIAGLRGAGKTAMVLAMIHELRRHKIAGQDLVLTGLGDTEARFGALMRAFFEGEKPGVSWSELPGADIGPGSATSNFCWELVLASKRQRPAMLLAFHDLAGETWKEMIGRSLPRFERYLRLLASLVLVVDGAAVATDLGFPARDAWDAAPRLAGGGFADDHQMLATLVDRLGEHAANVNVAIVISKADLFWHDSRWQALQQLADGRVALGDEHQNLLKDLLTETNRRDLVLASQHKFRSVRLFAVSSLGFRPQTADVRDERLTRRIEPAGVLGPLEWLLCETRPALRNS